MPILYSKKEFLFAGVQPERVPPLPIPNREVKAFRPDDTWACPGKVGYAGIQKLLFYLSQSVVFNEYQESLEPNFECSKRRHNGDEVVQFG